MDFGLLLFDAGCLFRGDELSLETFEDRCMWVFLAATGTDEIGAGFDGVVRSMSGTGTGWLCRTGHAWLDADVMVGVV